MIDFKLYRSILCLDGDLPNADFFNSSALPIIAADGAANKLVKMGVRPQIVIGDLDGLDKNLLDQLPTFYDNDQNFSDFDKSLAYLRKKTLLPAIIVGVNGGYLDHILNNVNIFINSNCILYAPPLIGFVLCENQLKSYQLKSSSKISILGMPYARVTSKGLKWELADYVMSFPGKNSCLNQTIAENIQIEVHEGTALILIYLEEPQ